MDSRGFIDVTDARNDAVQIYDRRGHRMLSYGSNGTTPGFFSQPEGLWVDAADRAYVVDAGNRRIQVIQCVSGEGSDGGPRVVTAR